MAISYVASTNQNNGSTTSAVASLPAGAQAGDILVAFIAFLGGSSITISGVPSGWTLLQRNNTGATGGDVGAASYWKLAGGSEPSTYTWTLSSAVNNTGCMMAFRGCNQANPIDASGGQNNASSTSVTAPGVTTTTDQDALAFFAGIAAVTTFTPPSGMTEASDTNNIELAYQLGIAPGATGNKVATAGSAQINIGQLVALRPFYMLDRGDERRAFAGLMRGTA